MASPAILFFLTALIYASVGFGGGSTYNAILILIDTDYRIVPLLALICNIIVVMGGVFHFHRKGYLAVKRLLPWILFSAPAAFAGGMIPVSELYFTLLLGCALLASGIRLLAPDRPDHTTSCCTREKYKYAPPFLAAGQGLAAGLTGIGGGIFLAPVLHLTRWGNAKQIAAGCALFILVNSLAGLAGQAIKMADYGTLALAIPYWPLIPAVIIGGQIGSYTGAGHMNMRIIKKMTGILILYVSARMLIEFAGAV